jgi:hypothetical protein
MIIENPESAVYFNRINDNSGQKAISVTDNIRNAKNGKVEK